jgi:hypothetical protein
LAVRPTARNADRPNQVGDDEWSLSTVRTYTEAGVYEIGWEAERISIWHAPLL